MRKILSILLLVTLITTLLPIVNANETLELKIETANSILLEEGNEFTISLISEEAPTTLQTLDVTLTYDTKVVKLIKIDNPVLKSFEAINVIDNTTGTARIAYTTYPSGSKITKNQLVKYTFEVVSLDTELISDENAVFNIDKSKSVFIDVDGYEFDINFSECKIFEVPEVPYKSSPSGKTFTGSAVVKLKTKTDDATIYYTTNGTKPDISCSEYVDGIKITKSTTIKAIAVKNGIASDIYSVEMSMLSNYTGGGGGGGGSSSGGFINNTANNNTANNIQTNVTTSTSNLQAEQSKYQDIANHWAKKDIENLIEKNIINGYDDGTVQPDKEVTRAEAAKIIVVALGLAPASDITITFDDNEDMPQWAIPYIQTAIEKGIFTGYEDNTFKASKTVSRQELAVIAMRAFDMGTSSVNLAFTDTDSIPEWAYGFVSKAVEEGIITGYSDNTFLPAKNVTRAEVCTILSRCLN